MRIYVQLARNTVAVLSNRFKSTRKSSSILQKISDLNNGVMIFQQGDAAILPVHQD